MFSKNWQVIKDDVKKTFEVCGQERNTDHFNNQVIAMQRAGMNVSCILPPVTNRNASREAIKITGYTPETGLFDRLQQEHQRRIRESLWSIELEDFNDID